MKMLMLMSQVEVSLEMKRRKREEIIPGRALFYATSFFLVDEVTGLLVESQERRPTKIEGNPSHPQSLGGTDLWQQASVLDLYDPDRVQSPKKEGKAISLDELKIGLVLNSVQVGQTGAVVEAIVDHNVVLGVLFDQQNGNMRSDES